MLRVGFVLRSTEIQPACFRFVLPGRGKPWGVPLTLRVAARAFEVSRCQESYPHEVSGKSTRIQVRACFIDFCALRSAGQSSAEHILGRGRVQRGLLGRRPRSSASAPDPGHGRPWVVPLTSHEHNISSLRRRHAGTTESSTETPVGQKPDPLQILCRPSVEWLKSRCPGS